MINETDAYYLVPLLMICISIATGAYKKSISTSLFLGALFVSGFVFTLNVTASAMVLSLAGFAMLIRAIINHEEDTLYKG